MHLTHTKASNHQVWQKATILSTVTGARNQSKDISLKISVEYQHQHWYNVQYNESLCRSHQNLPVLLGSLTFLKIQIGRLQLRFYDEQHTENITASKSNLRDWKKRSNKAVPPTNFSDWKKKMGRHDQGWICGQGKPLCFWISNRLQICRISFSWQ